MQKTSIEWVLNPDGSPGFTSNPLTGCLGPKGDGVHCPYCYARKLANGRLRNRYLANRKIAPFYFNSYEALNVLDTKNRNDPFYPRFWPERLEQIRKHKKGIIPVGIFLDDMSDWMGDYWPEAWTEAELQVMKDCPQNRFYTLTKQPQNLIKWSPFPDNCWVGVTATNPFAFYKALEFVKEIDASIVYLSLEPFLQEIKIPAAAVLNDHGISWLIIGACTGTLNELKPMAMKYPDLALMPYGNKWTLQPQIEWVEEIVKAADKAGIPVFLKDNLKPLLVTETNGGLVVESHNLWAFKYFKLRQEMPK